MNAVSVCFGKYFLLLLLAYASFGTFLTEEASAGAKDSKIRAVYNINFNGLNIGEFKLDADILNQEYTLVADARISLLAGLLFDWHGITKSSGQVEKKGPSPRVYSFGYKTSDKSERINLEFAENSVREIAISPPQKNSAMRVPLTRQHMRNVVDPLSALILLTNVGTKKSGKEVCNQRLPIFDGKARYDLVLSYKKTKQVDGGIHYRGRAFVCKVKFVPIAGHRPGNDDSDFAASNDGIELWMIPISKAELYVPYYIYLPTPVGNATLTSSEFTVETPDKTQRAGALLQ